jgi:ribulose-phosphate 3-epimerase
VDGGIHTGTAASVVRAGATVLVVGSGLFNEKAPVAENLQGLRAAMAASDSPEVRKVMK